MEEVQFKDWVEDAAKMLVEQCGGPTVLVGSSMGGWISLLLASKEETRELVKGLVLVAPALNFFRPHYHQMASELSVEQQAKLERGETVAVEDEYGITYLRKSFADASAELELDLSRPLDISVPCRILHGARDATIPYRNSVELMEKVVGSQRRQSFHCCPKIRPHLFQQRRRELERRGCVTQRYRRSPTMR